MSSWLDQRSGAAYLDSSPESHSGGGPVRRVATLDRAPGHFGRQPSFDFGNTAGSALQSPPPQMQQPPPPQLAQHKHRSSIMSGASTVAPLALHSNSPLGRAALPAHPAPQSGPLDDEGSLSDRNRADSLNQQQQQSSSGTVSAAPTHRRNASNAPTRSLSPLRSRPSITERSPASALPSSNSGTPRLAPAVTPSSSSATAAPATHSPVGAGGVGVYIGNAASGNGATATLAPSTAPSPVTPLPHASGVLVALHVSGTAFITTPETLLRCGNWESGGGVGVRKGSRHSQSDDAPLLQWIAEDALSKHREAEASARAASSPAGFSSLSPLSVKPSTRGNNGLQSAADPSPRDRLPPPSFSPGAPISSTVHQSGAGALCPGAPAPLTKLAFHAPTYSYYLDRSPLAYPSLLVWLRDGPSALRKSLLAVHSVADLSLLAALKVEAEYLNLPALSALVDSVQSLRDSAHLLSDEDRLWKEVVETIDRMFPLDSSDGAAPAAPQKGPRTISPSFAPSASPTDGGRPISPLSRMEPSAVVSSPHDGGSGGGGSSTTLQRNIGAMLRRLAFQRDSMLRVCFAAYRHAPEFEDRLLEILHTQCTLCKRTVYFRPIGLREGRDTGCPVHPSGGVWDRKQRMWTCCGLTTQQQRTWRAFRPCALRPVAGAPVVSCAGPGHDSHSFAASLRLSSSARVRCVSARCQVPPISRILAARARAFITRCGHSGTAQTERDSSAPRSLLLRFSAARLFAFAFAFGFPLSALLFCFLWPFLLLCGAALCIEIFALVARFCFRRLANPSYVETFNLSIGNF